MRSSNSARINKFDFRTEKSCSVHMTVFKIVAGHNVVNWMQLLTSVKTMLINIFAKKLHVALNCNY